MHYVYNLISSGASPLSLADAKTFMKVSSTSDDAVIQSMIDAATQWGQKYTGRAFTDNTWQLLLDFFSDRIKLSRDPVASVTSVKNLVSGVQQTIDNTIYYLKKSTQFSEILLFNGKDWPEDTDEREQAIEIEFVTESYYCKDEILDALKRHVLYLYSNRGDCDTKEAADSSGVTFIYDQFRISRV